MLRQEKENHVECCSENDNTINKSPYCYIFNANANSGTSYIGNVINKSKINTDTKTDSPHPSLLAVSQFAVSLIHGVAPRTKIKEKSLKCR